MHFRGCSGQINRKAHSYHSGETCDPRFILQLLAQKYSAPMAAVREHEISRWLSTQIG